MPVCLTQVIYPSSVRWSGKRCPQPGDFPSHSWIPPFPSSLKFCAFLPCALLPTESFPRLPGRLISPDGYALVFLPFYTSTTGFLLSDKPSASQTPPGHFFYYSPLISYLLVFLLRWDHDLPTLLLVFSECSTLTF